MTATRDLVTIGQRWRLRDRRRTNPTVITILQVWRADRTVCARDADGTRRSIAFSELRRRYELLGPLAAGGGTHDRTRACGDRQTTDDTASDRSGA